MPLTDITARPIALVGLMGVGKTTIGRRLAKRLERPFYDSDDEIELASGRTVAGYFRDHGEADFRNGERRVIERLLDKDAIILSTGGGAFIHPPTRDALQERAVTIWLKGDFETIMTRVSRKDTRPLLKVADPRAKMRELMEERNPIYAKADVHVDIAGGPHLRTVNRVMKALRCHAAEAAKQAKKTESQKPESARK
jgi:shikimate kinase